MLNDCVSSCDGLCAEGGSGAFTTMWALMEMGGCGPVWQDPCTGRCAVGSCFVYDLGWRLQDKLRDPLHRIPHAFNPRVEMSLLWQHFSILEMDEAAWDTMSEDWHMYLSEKTTSPAV